MKVFEVIKPTGTPIPVILSIPHSGTYFPESIRSQFNEKIIQEPEDTDWHLGQLYDFAAELGIVTIKANISRWVIDLNRDPDSVPLYDDGRIITQLLPEKTFSGKNIYNNYSPTEEDRMFRLDHYYWPYYEAIQKRIEELKMSHPNILIWDAHSIKQKVTAISNAAFPDLILGDNEIRSANPLLINKAIEILNTAGYSFSHNHPFKGGHITRYFGNPSKGIHALQLEMTKVNYMEKNELDYHEINASQLKALLRKSMDILGKFVETL